MDIIEYDVNQLTIIDNFLNEEEYFSIKNLLYDKNFSWRRSRILGGLEMGSKGEKIKTNIDPLLNIQFVHSFYIEADCPHRSPGIVSKSFKGLFPIFKKINPFHLIRVKANCTLNHGKIIEGFYHVDAGLFGGLGMTAILYFTNSNGPTKFENGYVVESVENRIAIFPNEWYHTGIRGDNSAERIVLNINWIDPKRFDGSQEKLYKKLEEIQYQQNKLINQNVEDY